jgi:threonine/homoserine/homoserine lactone efflux protein
MLESLVALVKIAGFSTLAILAWLALSSRGDGEREAPAEGPPEEKDPQGARVMRAFSGMLLLGAVAMLALSVVGIVADVV